MFTHPRFQESGEGALTMTDSVLISSISTSSLGPAMRRDVTLRVEVLTTAFDALGQRPSLSSHSPHRGPTGRHTT